jgi:hypothetical protein
MYVLLLIYFFFFSLFFLIHLFYLEMNNHSYLLMSSTEGQFAVLLEEENTYKIINLAYGHLPLESSS